MRAQRETVNTHTDKTNTHMVSSFQKAVSSKIRHNYHEMRAGRLHIGRSNKRVRSPEQLKAISYSEVKRGRGRRNSVRSSSSHRRRR